MERLGLDCRRDSLFNMSANTTQTFRNFIVIESWRIGMRRLTRNDGLNPLCHHLLSGRVPMMTLVHTLAVAEYLNFRHAANALGVAQSSVSARVKALEEDLGILLFERRARGVRLTEAGRHFVERIAAGVDQLDHAVKTAGMAATGEWG